MKRFHPCSACNRHVRVDEDRCPFCAAELAAPAPLPSGRGRVARAALFAGAALLGSACGGDAAEEQDDVDIGQGDVTSGGEGDRDDGDGDGDGDHVDEQYDDMNYDMPYGAPPVRDRLV